MCSVIDGHCDAGGVTPAKKQVPRAARRGGRMQQKEDLRIVRTRKLLSATLLEMMEEQSIEKISVIDLCTRAMVNRATFYAHFEDKYHLLSFALEELKDKIYAKFTKEFYAESPRDVIRSVTFMAVSYLADKQSDIARVVKFNRNERVVHTLTESLAQSIKYQLGKVRDRYPSEVPAQMTAMCYAGAMVSLLIWLLDTPSALADPMLGEKLDALIAENLR